MKNKMKKYIPLLFLLTACNKPNLFPPPTPCEDRIVVNLNFHLTDQKNISYIEVQFGTENQLHTNGAHLYGEPGIEEQTYTQEVTLGDQNSIKSKMIIWRAKVFAQDRSFYYTAYDTLVK
jgi:hypothetical protein